MEDVIQRLINSVANSGVGLRPSGKPEYLAGEIEDFGAEKSIMYSDNFEIIYDPDNKEFYVATTYSTREITPEFLEGLRICRELCDVYTEEARDLDSEEEIQPEEEPEEDTDIKDETFVDVMEKHSKFKKVEDFVYDCTDNNDDYQMRVSYDPDLDLAEFKVTCGDVYWDWEYVSRMMGPMYRHNRDDGDGACYLVVQMDLAKFEDIVNSQYKSFINIVDDSKGQDKARTSHAFTAEIKAKPQKSKDQEEAAKRLESYVKWHLAPLVDDDPEWNSFFLDTPREFKLYRLDTVGIMLTCYDMKASRSKLEKHPIFRKMLKAKKVVRKRTWQKSKDPDGNKCWMTIYVDAQWVKEHGSILIDEKKSIEYDGKLYEIKRIVDEDVLIENEDNFRMISIEELLELI